MTECENQFISVLSSALHNKSLPPDEYKYNEILNLASRQQLFALIFEKFCEDEKFLKTEVYSEYYKYNINLVVSQTIRTERFFELYNYLSQQGLTLLVMKGIICRKLYGKFEDHRPSGDEDIVVSENEFCKAYELLCQLGFIPNKNLPDIDIDKLQAVSFKNRENTLNIELHVNPIGKGNALNCKMNEYFSRVFDNYIEFLSDSQKLLTFNYTEHFLFLCFHAFKHIAGSGCGIRQITDILLFREKYLNKIDFDFINKSLKDVNAFLFYSDILYIGSKYLGFDCSPEEICCPEDLLADFLSSGIFGNDTDAKIMAGTLTSMAVKNNVLKNRTCLSAVVESVFPDFEYMKKFNPELNEKPWRLPVEWVKRWGRFVKRNNKSGGNLASESLQIGNRRIELLKKYNIL